MKHLNAIILYNVADFIDKQIELLRENVGGDIMVIDNSDNYKIATQVRKKCAKLKVQYVKTSVNDADFSRSHAYACEVAYNMAKEEYDSLMIVDHDMFPVQPYPLERFEDKLLGGIEQIRGQLTENQNIYKLTYHYIQPAIMYINIKLLDAIQLNFFPCIAPIDVYLDTGGGLYSVVMGNPKQIYYFKEEHKYTENKFMYSLIEDVWVHFINGCNWKKDEGHEARIFELLKLL